MINLDIDYSSKSSCLIEADKKNIRIESAAIIILGSFYLLLFSIIMHPNYYLSFIPISILYITTGISGCMCLRNNSSSFQTIYKVLIIVSMIAKVILIILSFLLIGFLILNPFDCSKGRNETCGMWAAFWLFLFLFSTVGLIIFSATLTFFYVMLKHLNKFQEDIKLLGFIHSE